MPLKLMECGPKCKSKRHALEFNASISKGTLDEIKCYCALCYNGGQLLDIYGRSALHVAASCGKLDVVEWLLEEKHGDVTQKDSESGWTALHRAIFYGQLNTARLLIQYRSDLYTRDHEGLGPLDIAMKDRNLISNNKLAAAVYEITDPHDVYTWGDNSNFTLGHVTEQKRHLPEVVDEFRKQNINIVQAVMSKYHSVFLSSDNKVYTCGHGHGGRLGHLTEETCLVPKQVQTLSGETIVQVAAARDHTLFLSKSGCVYSCGTNQYHQLGQVPAPDKCLVPRAVNCKTVKGQPVQGVCAGRFHTVLYTAKAVFSCGLNAGQLGHPKMKGDDKISQLRQVSALNIKGLTIVDVKCSDAATVVVTETGEIFVLHEYQCRKIASNRRDIQRLCVVGGNLDHSDSQVLRENGGQQLVISLLDTSGKVFVWREDSPSLKRARWLIRRLLYVVDFVLTQVGLAIVTDTGEVFTCTLTNKPPVKEAVTSPSKDTVETQFGRMSLMDLLLKEETEEIHVHRVPNIHRAMYINADKREHNYTVLQVQPNFSLTDVPTVSPCSIGEDMKTLLDEADEYDLIHDLIIQVTDHVWPVHRYVLLSRCTNFASLFPDYIQVGSSKRTDIPVLNICDMHPQIMEQLLEYIYTDFCDLLSPGASFHLSDVPTLNTHASPKDDCIFDMDFEGDNKFVIETAGTKVSAFEVHQQSKKSGRSGGSSKSGLARKGGKSGVQQNSGKDPVKLLQDVARKWGVKGLTRRLDCVKYTRGHIESTAKKHPQSSLQFYRDKHRDSKFDLCDVNIMSTDGEVFPCHKCILVARLEYFHHMLMSGWMETSSSDSLSLPVAADILEILLDFIYTDTSNVVLKECKNVEFLCNILVVADQLLVTRLKEMCEVAIATFITMKNVGELLEFASVYNALQLKATCQQYIILNLPALLENCCLDVLSDNVMDDLSKYYRISIENMSRRMITPYDEGPSKQFLESLWADSQPADSVSPGVVGEPKKTKPRKKRNRTKSAAEDHEKGPDKGSEKGSDGLQLLEREPSRGQGNSIMENIRKVEKSEGEKFTKKTLDINMSKESIKKVADVSAGEMIGKNSVSNDTSQKQSITEKPLSRPTSTPWGPSPAKGSNPVSPVTPVGVAKWGSSASSPPLESLRDIMEKEQRQNNLARNHDSQSSGKFSWKGVKKQQQQKLQQNNPQQNQHPEKQDSLTESQPTLKSPKGWSQDSAGSCPWGSVTKTSQPSFESLLAEEKASKPGVTSTATVCKSRKPEPSTRSRAVPIVAASSWGLPILKTTPNKSKSDTQRDNNSSSNTNNNSVTSPVSPRENPWGAAGLAKSPQDTACSFTRILEAEIEQCDMLDRTSNKPLALIQMEEKAIHDLLQLYHADTNVDEHITVERVTRLAATPVWKRERLQSS